MFLTGAQIQHRSFNSSHDTHHSKEQWNPIQLIQKSKQRKTCGDCAAESSPGIKALKILMLCVHRCLSVHSGSLSKGVGWGVRVSVQGSLWLKGLCPGGLCQGDSPSRTEFPRMVKSGRYIFYRNAFLLLKPSG